MPEKSPESVTEPSRPPMSGHVPPEPPKDPRKLTGPERRRRIVLLTVLLLLLALLVYVAYYFAQNRRLPTLGISPPGANAVTPPQFLYAFSGEGANQLKRPVGVAVGPDRRVYVVDFGNKRVSVFTNEGRFLFSFSTVAGGKLSNPVHLVIKGNEVWVTDRRLRSISVFDLEGKFLRTFEPKNEKLNWTPLALGFDNTGALRVTDVGNTKEHRVIYFSAGRLAHGYVRKDRPGHSAYRVAGRLPVPQRSRGRQQEQRLHLRRRQPPSSGVLSGRRRSRASSTRAASRGESPSTRSSVSTWSTRWQTTSRSTTLTASRSRSSARADSALASSTTRMTSHSMPAVAST